MKKSSRLADVSALEPDTGLPDEASDILMEVAGEAETVPARTNAKPPIETPPKLVGPVPLRLRNRVIVEVTAPFQKPRAYQQGVEAVVVARGGGVMLVGWIDDQDCPLEAVTVVCGSWRLTFDGKSLARVRRPDVEAALGQTARHCFGFFGLVASADLPDTHGKAEVVLHMADGGSVNASVTTRRIGPEELRDLVLGYLSSAVFYGNPQIDGAACLDGGLGNQIIALNRTITSRIVAGRHIERFGARQRRPRGSIIVCLYGKAEFLFVQNALFAGLPGIEDYEFIFVSNSPEISETMLREAKLCQQVYGLNQTVVLLPGNAGFGAANNAGVTAALGERILNVNPDVFPRQADWAARHTALVDQLPAAQTNMFGVPLYYDDGSLMHGGMYFEIDDAVSLQAEQVERRRMIRVEHYGKGAPAWSATHIRPRPVPALTGAFISSDRAWYEQLGGFTQDFVFGHYEDADLCLKSLVTGTPVWLHDLRLWHLEGKGSTRRAHHEGGSLVNRWHFTRTWLPTVSNGLVGPNPTNPALAETPPAPPPALGATRPLPPAVPARKLRMREQMAAAAP
jgi:GT2 family glycosyltransferase